MLWINLILIANIVVFVIDNTDFINTIKKFLHRKYIKQGDYHNMVLKPFDCSLCSTFWVCSLYLLCSLKLNVLSLSFVCLLAFITPQIKDLQNFIADFIQTLINILYTFITPH